MIYWNFGNPLLNPNTLEKRHSLFKSYFKIYCSYYKWLVSPSDANHSFFLFLSFPFQLPGLFFFRCPSSAQLFSHNISTCISDKVANIFFSKFHYSYLGSKHLAKPVIICVPWSWRALFLKKPISSRCRQSFCNLVDTIIVLHCVAWRYINLRCLVVILLRFLDLLLQITDNTEVDKGY